MFLSRRVWLRLIVFAGILLATGWQDRAASGQGAGAPRLGSPRVTSPAETQYTLAASYYEQQRWRQAAEEFHKFVVQFPADGRRGDAMFYEGEALMQLQDFARAQAAFGELLKTNPPEATVKRSLFRRGEALFLTGDRGTAGELLNEFSTRFADDPMVAYAKPYLAEIAQQDGDDAKARELYTGALEAFPEGPLADNCRLGLANSLAALGQREDAARFFDFLIQQQGSLAAEAMLGRMQLAFAEGQHEEVERFALEFERSYAASTLADAVSRVRGKSQLKQGDYHAAEATFSGLASAPNRKPLEVAGDAYYLAVAHLGQEEYEEARDVAGSVQLADLPNTVAGELLSARGAALAGLKDYAAAAADLEKSLALHPDSPDRDRRRAQLAVSLTNAGELDRAESELSTMATSASDRGLFADAARHFAETALDKRDSARAEKWFNMLVDEPASEAETNNSAADEQPDESLAEPTAPAPALASPKSNDAVADLSGLAWSQWKNEQFDAAASSFGRLADESPTHELAAEAALMRGKALERLGRSAEALHAFQAVIENYGESAECPEAMLSGALLIASGVQDQMAAQGSNPKAQAASLLGQLIDRFPDFSRLDAAIYERAWLLDEVGETEEADRAFVSLSTNYPNSDYWADATYRVAERAARSKDHESAKAALGQLRAAECDDEIKTHALFLESQIAAAEQRWREVAAPLKEVVEKWPQHELALSAKYWIAESLFQSQEYTAAEEQFLAVAQDVSQQTEQAAADSTGDSWLPMVSLRRAQLFARRQKWDEAYELAAAIPAQFPNFRQLYEVDYLIGRCLGKRGEFEEAREAYERVTLSPEGGRTETAAMAQWMIGESFFHQKRYDEAIRAYDVVVANYNWPKWQAGAMLQGGKCYELKGERAEAEKQYARLLKDYPDSPFSAEAASRLKREAKAATKGPATKANKL